MENLGRRSTNLPDQKTDHHGAFGHRGEEEGQDRATGEGQEAKRKARDGERGVGGAISHGYVHDEQVWHVRLVRKGRC